MLALAIALCGGPAAAGAAPRADAGLTPSTARIALARRTPPVLALRPEVSEGEWATDTTREQLSPNDLASAAATVLQTQGAARSLRDRATMGGVRDRPLRDAPIMVESSLDQPLSEVSSEPVELPIGLQIFRFGERFGVTVTQDGSN